MSTSENNNTEVKKEETKVKNEGGETKVEEKTETKTESSSGSSS